jgi:hypothetical protein
MKIVATLIFSFALSSAAWAGNPELWRNPFTLDMNTAKVVVQIPPTAVVEVAASKLEDALQRLTSQSIIPQEPYDAVHFGQPVFVCQPPTRLYLVRAVYTNGNTGGFHLQRVENTLWVAHSSLGASSGDHRSALLVCLDFTPEQVFVTADGAM